jgi:predicted phosphodiesterase
MRILSIGDFHCGNRAGLTPTKYNLQSEHSYKEYVYRRNCWDWFSGEVKALGKIDVCVANGDLIDGKGPKSGGNDQIEQDRTLQIEMAVAALKSVKADRYYIAYGTGYHVGPEDDWEKEIAYQVGAEINDVVSLNVNGLIMKWRHHIGGSQTPSGRATPLLRQQEWDTLWSLGGEFERADVMVFGHTHYFQAIINRYGTAIIAPALQALGGSQLGARRLGGIVDYGFLHFDVDGKDSWSWHPHLVKQTSAFRASSPISVTSKPRTSSKPTRRSARKATTSL